MNQFLISLVTPLDMINWREEAVVRPARVLPLFLGIIRMQ